MTEQEHKEYYKYAKALLIGELYDKNHVVKSLQDEGISEDDAVMLVDEVITRNKSQYDRIQNAHINEDSIPDISSDSQLKNIFSAVKWVVRKATRI